MTGGPTTPLDLYAVADALPRTSRIRPILFRRAAELQRRQEAGQRTRAHRYHRLHIAGALEWRVVWSASA